MSEIVWRLRHADEFFWEPIMKWWHRNRQARVEHDYWAMKVKEYEKDCQHVLDLMERSWSEPRDGTTWLHCKKCQKHVWTVPTRLLA